MKSSKILVIGKNSLFSKTENYKSDVKLCSIRDNFDKIINNVLPSEIASSIEVGYKNIIVSSGIILPKKTLEKNFSEIQESLTVNLVIPVLLSEMMLRQYDDVHILIIGSESGVKGSYDTEYWLAKAALRSYVMERQVGHNQNLNMLSPSVILDSPMTQNRSDLDNLLKTAMPRNKFLYARDVINLSEDIFNHKYLCNAVIDMNGGKFARQHYK